MVMLFFVSVYLLPFTINDANAASYDIKDIGSCQSISGTWDSTTSTCTISDLTLGSGDLLFVDNSAFPSLSLVITSSLENNGGAIKNSGGITIGNSAVLNNNGSIVNYCTGQCAGGIIQNEGTITNYKTGTIKNNATVNNQGSVNNSGEIAINNGTLVNAGKFINNPGGGVDNHGTVHNTQLSAIINNGGTIVNYATLVSDGGATITNSGTFKSMCGATFENNGDLFGNPVNSTSCVKSPGSTVPEFPLSVPVLLIAIFSSIMLHKIKTRA